MDGWIPFTKPREHGFPLARIGYTRFFETGNALNYGVAYAYPLDKSHSVQVEARDYWVFTSPQQHDVVLRMAWLVGIPD